MGHTLSTQRDMVCTKDEWAERRGTGCLQTEPETSDGERAT